MTNTMQAHDGGSDLSFYSKGDRRQQCQLSATTLVTDPDTHVNRRTDRVLACWMVQQVLANIWLWSIHMIWTTNSLHSQDRQGFVGLDQPKQNPQVLQLWSSRCCGSLGLSYTVQQPQSCHVKFSTLKFFKVSVFLFLCVSRPGSEVSVS